jgi:transcriptional/translational regulatory protein YebC/TACO1
LEARGIAIESSDLTFVPQTTVRLEGKQAEQMLKLMDALDENDDVEGVYANFDIDESIMENI